MSANTHAIDVSTTPNPGDLHIAIVGGGTAGWMSAATLKRRLGCRVTLIESSQTPAIGVGEATIPAMVDWIDNMGIDEDEFLRQCGGTYKLAIRFDNWITPEHQYWHPFGVCGGKIDGIDLIHHWRRGVTQGWLDGRSRYTDFSIQRQLCESGKSLRPRRSLAETSGSPASTEQVSNVSDFSPNRHRDAAKFAPPIVANYAFHLDAGRLAEFIKSVALADGVVHRIGHVTGAERSRDGDITSVHVRDQPSISADLYVDCSGFASVLSEKTLQTQWVDWSELLLCDRAITARQSNESISVPTTAANSPDPFTVCTARDAGWTWRIPLSHATGNGYVYSSRHVSDESAKQEFASVLGRDTEFHSVRFRVGHRPQSWCHNCVAIGLSSGFVEPLESTGIFLVQRALDELVEALTGASTHVAPATRFNRHMVEVYHEIRDFVLLHYVISERDDKPFWRDARAVELPDSLAASIERYEQLGVVELPKHDPVFAEANHHFIMNGANRLTPTLDQLVVRHPRKRVPSPIQSDSRLPVPQEVASRHTSSTVSSLIQSMRQRHDEIVTSLPSHQTLLQSIHATSPNSPR